MKYRKVSSYLSGKPDNAYEYQDEKTRKWIRVYLADTEYPESDPEYDLCVCPYSNGLSMRRDAVVLGAIVPQAKISFLSHPLAKDARLKSQRQFQEIEKNCNTCRHLLRVPFKKDVSGLQPGECLFEGRKPLYPRDGNKIMFAPDDWMGQECYESRS